MCICGGTGDSVVCSVMCNVVCDCVVVSAMCVCGGGMGGFKDMHSVHPRWPECSHITLFALRYVCHRPHWNSNHLCASWQIVVIIFAYVMSNMHISVNFEAM